MRQTISGLVAALAVMTAGAAPAFACGFTWCAPAYVPTVVGIGCYTGCGGWVYERLAEPTTQYYYVNQGPTYSGPGMFAPYPTYQESAVSAPAVYGYRWHHHFRHHGYHRHYGYIPRHSGYRVPRRTY